MSDEPKKKRKHRKHTLNDSYYGNKLHKEKYGFVEIDNPLQEGQRLLGCTGVFNAKADARRKKGNHCKLHYSA